MFALSVLGTTVYAGGDFTTASGGASTATASRPSSRPGTARRFRAGTRARTASSTPSTPGTTRSTSAATSPSIGPPDEDAARGGRRERDATQAWNPARTTPSTRSPTSARPSTRAAPSRPSTATSRAAPLRRSTPPRAPPPRGTRGSCSTRAARPIVITLAPTLSTMYLGGFFDRGPADCAPSCFFSPGPRGDLARRRQRAHLVAAGSERRRQRGRRRAAGRRRGRRLHARSATRPPATPPDEPGATYRGGLAVLPGLPDAPSVTATPGDASATVTVQLPAFVGGGAVGRTR